MTEDRVFELARLHSSYQDTLTIRGKRDVLAFAKAILAESEGKRIDELLSVRATLDSGAIPQIPLNAAGVGAVCAVSDIAYTPPGTHGSAAAPEAA